MTGKFGGDSSARLKLVKRVIAKYTAETRVRKQLYCMVTRGKTLSLAVRELVSAGGHLTPTQLSKILLAGGAVNKLSVKSASLDFAPEGFPVSNC